MKINQAFFETVTLRIRKNLIEFVPAGAGMPAEFIWPEHYCPHCKREPKYKSYGYAVSFSGFYYNEENTIIYYWLCSRCANRIPRIIQEADRRKFSEITEVNLIDAYIRSEQKQASKL